MAHASKWAWRKALHRLFSLEREDCRLFFYLEKDPIGNVFWYWHQRESTLADQCEVGKFWYCLEVCENRPIFILSQKLNAYCPGVARIIRIWGWLSCDFGQADNAFFFSGVVNKDSIAGAHGAYVSQC